jgi:hypothetical protein
VHVQLSRTVQLSQTSGGAEESTEIVTCKSPIREAPSVGQTVRLELDAKRVHLFDPQTGANLAGPNSAGVE